MNKIIDFYYKRDSLPHSEYKVIQSLTKFKNNENQLHYKISTSTASIFNIVRGFCYLHDIELKAHYEDLDLKVDENMRMNQWSDCFDFELNENVLECLLTPKDELKNYTFIF